jgi:hypothetical protein
MDSRINRSIIDQVFSDMRVIIVIVVFSFVTVVMTLSVIILLTRYFMLLQAKKDKERQEEQRKKRIEVLKEQLDSIQLPPESGSKDDADPYDESYIDGNTFTYATIKLLQERGNQSSTSGAFSAAERMTMSDPL